MDDSRMTSDPASPRHAGERALSERDGDKIEAALQEVYALASGKRRWTMRVPPEDIDSDLIISAGLDVAKEALAALDQARAERDRERTAWADLAGKLGDEIRRVTGERDQARADLERLEIEHTRLHSALWSIAHWVEDETNHNGPGFETEARGIAWNAIACEPWNEDAEIPEAVEF